MNAKIGDNSMQIKAKHQLVVGCLLLGIAAVPDAMVVPVLHDLNVVRFGVSDGAAHLFMAVNLVGAVLVVGLLALLNRRVSTSKLLLIAAACSCVLMAAMAIAPNWSLLLTLRCFEGGADLILLSIPFRMIASCGKGDRYGGRMGVAFTVMFVALAIGAGSGAIIGKVEATNVLWVASASSALLFLFAAIFARTVGITTASPRPDRGSCPLIPSEWIGAIFLSIDRGLAALVSVTLSILIVPAFQVGPITLGVSLGGMFLALAVFSTPAGILADRIGGIRVRIIAACMCGVGLLGLGLMNVVPPVVILAPSLLLYGVGSAGLMPSAFTCCVRSEASTLVFSSLQAAGQLGYTCGILVGGVLVAVIALPPETMLTRMFPIAGVVFIGVNLFLVGSLRVLENRVR